MEVFAIAAAGSLQSLGRFETGAYLDPHVGELGDFAKTVAINRGMPIAFLG